MQIIGSGFRHVLRHHTGGASVFRIVVGCGDFHLLNRILVGNDDLEAAETISSIRDSVDLVFAISEELAIHHRIVELRWVFAFTNLEKVFHHAGR